MSNRESGARQPMREDTQHPALLEPDRLLAQCDVRRERRSGPGGQHRNKVETAVVIRHRPTGIEAGASERRSQAENRRNAIRRLRERLALRVRTSVDWAGVPSPLWQSRCRGGRLAVRRDHDDFPTLLAEALNVVMDRNADLTVAAEYMGCTRSQLTKLLKVAPEALQLVNRRRQSLGLSPLQ